MTAEQTRKAALAASKEAQARAKRENAKHTPGPWVVRTIDQSLATVETQDGEYIICAAAQLRGDDWKTEHAERKANARLIAAAPEMLEALRNICDEQDAQQGYASLAAYDQARAIIAKATGDTQ